MNQKDDCDATTCKSAVPQPNKSATSPTHIAWSTLTGSHAAPWDSGQTRPAGISLRLRGSITSLTRAVFRRGTKFLARFSNDQQTNTLKITLVRAPPPPSPLYTSRTVHINLPVCERFAKKTVRLIVLYGKTNVPARVNRKDYLCSGIGKPTSMRTCA
jgi:hypothetical protein